MKAQKNECWEGKVENKSLKKETELSWVTTSMAPAKGLLCRTLVLPSTICTLGLVNKKPKNPTNLQQSQEKPSEENSTLSYVSEWETTHKVG